MIPDLCQHGRAPRPADLADDRARPGLHAVRQRIDGLHVVHKDIRHAQPGLARRIIVEIDAAQLPGQRLRRGVRVQRQMEILPGRVGIADGLRGAAVRVVARDGDAAGVQIRHHFVRQRVHPVALVAGRDVGIEILCGRT